MPEAPGADFPPLEKLPPEVEQNLDRIVESTHCLAGFDNATSQPTWQ
jgi:hypothetical protein